MPKLALPPIGLVLAAGLADVAGAHAVGFWLLVLAVPAVAVAALATLDAALEPEGSKPLRHAWLQTAALVLILAAAAMRAPVRDTLPRIAVSAYVVCLIVFAVQGLLAAAPVLRRLAESRPSRITV